MPSQMIRSFLFVPGDAADKMRKALGAGADALILDLEDAVAPAAKATARETTASFLHAHASQPPSLWVRINPPSQPEYLPDLAMVVQPGLAGIVMPKINGPDDVERLSWQLDVLETRAGLAPGSVRLLAVATETAAAVFQAGNYHRAARRLYGLTWGAEDLAASLGASTNRTPDGALSLPYQLARTLCLTGARAAGVHPIETAQMDFRNTGAVSQTAVAARRDGFSGMLAIHPAQVDPINRAFSPDAAEIEHARRIVQAFEAAGNPGVLALDGRMLDIPHLRQAHAILALARQFAPSP